MLKKIALSIFLLSCLTAHTQTLDLSFNSPIPLKPADILDFAVLPDGKYLVGGRIAYFEDKRVHNLIRLNADGTLDQTFSFAPAIDYSVSRIEPLSSGDILVTTSYSNTLLRLNSSGEIIATTILPQAIMDIAIQENGQILICGGLDWANNYGFIKRYNSDLTPDLDFNNLATIDNGIVTTVRLFNSKIYLAGTFSSVNSTTKNDIVRLNMDGSLDPTFDTGAGTNDILRSITIQDDGKIIIGGKSYLTSFNNENVFGVGRLNANGTIDHSVYFNYGMYSQPSLVTYKDNKFWFGVSTKVNNKEDFYFLRYNDDGTLDDTFTPIQLDFFSGPDFPLVYKFINSDVVINRTNNLTRSGFSKLSLTGVRDISFQPDISYYGTISDADYKNGTLIVGGQFDRLDGFSTFNLGRLNADGTCDHAFSADNNSNTTPTIKIIDDDNVMVGGYNDILKVNSSGVLKPDFNFNLFEGLNTIEKFVFLPSGKIMISDGFKIYRLNSDGTRDTNFDSGSGGCCLGSSFDLAIQSNNKIIFGAAFETYNNISSKITVRLNESGAVDDTFKSGFGKTGDFVAGIKVLANDDLALTGYFSSYNDDPIVGHLIKVSSDGKSMDKTFTDNFPVDFYPTQVLEEDNNLIIPGRLIGNDPQPYKIKSFNMDGSSNDFFTLPENVKDLFTYKIVPLVDGYLLIGNYQVNDEPLNRQMIKLLKKKTITGIGLDKPEERISIYPVPASEELNVHSEEAVHKIKLLSTTGVEVFSQCVNKSSRSISIDVRNLPVGLYIITVTGQSGRTSTMKWLKN